MNTFDVLILSAHTKGTWLANELSHTNQKVAFMDVTSCLPVSTIEDQEGPFGFFIPEYMDTTHQEWWKRRWLNSIYGFSVLTPERFLHFKESFLSSVYQGQKDFRVIQDYFEKSVALNNSFQDEWLVRLSHYLVSGVDHSLNKKIWKAPALPSLFGDFGILSLQSNAESLLNPNIHFFKKNQWSLSVQKTKGRYQIRDHQGNLFLTTQQLVCLLNPEELKQIHSSLFFLFFKKEVLPLWCWRRFEFDFEFDGYPFPVHSVKVCPKKIPWTHEKLLCLKPSVLFSNRLNVWAKLPFADEGHSDSLRWIQEFNQELSLLFPHFQKKWRQNQSPTPSFLFPVYSDSGWKKLHVLSQPNVFYGHSPNDLSWNGVAFSEHTTLKHLLAVTPT